MHEPSDPVPASAPTQPAPTHPAPIQPAPIQPAPTTRRAASSASSILLAIGAVIAVGGLAFAAGRFTAPAAARGTGVTGGTGGFPGAQGGRGGGAGGGLFGAGALTLRGTVTATTGGTLTIRLGSGATVDVATDASTTYHRQAAASSDAVTTGSEVLVQVAPAAGGAQGGFGNPRASASPGASTRLGAARDVTLVAP